MTLVNTTRFDLSSIGGPKDGWISDSLFYEVDIKTNEIVHSWKATDRLDQIPMQDVVPLNPLREMDRNSSYPWGYLNVFACRNNATSEVDVYMSWNGATIHKAWTVFAGSRNETSALHWVATIGKQGFETKTSVPFNSKSLRVEATGKNTETGRSAITPVRHSC
ncbi:hypothetical protein KEM56_001290 [Ascosphaera pollenicola]|nr:hypothetical protein KEM56_001290 [Ascosphaera pollenicola]